MKINGNIVLVSEFSPNPSGHGGNHRAYQIFHDLAGCVGPENISSICRESPDKLLNPWLNHNPRHSPNPPSRLKLLLERLPYLRAAHPVVPLMGKWSQFHKFSPPHFSQFYAKHIAKLPKPLLCVMENAALGPALLPVNKRHGVRTIVCPQNIESWDRILPIPDDDPRQYSLSCLDFADEWNIFKQCDTTLFISKFEQTLCKSLGLSAQFYPYRPVGEIDEFWRKIRKARSEATALPGTFLMLGSCGHPVTRFAFESLIRHIAKSPNLPGFHLTIAGNLTETLSIPLSLSQHVERCGRIPQDMLQEKLTSTSAVLVPHELGFGSLTRLSEFSCGGVPVLASIFASHSMDPPPGIQWISTDHENAWGQAIEKAIPPPATCDEYDAWYSRQERPLTNAVRQYL